MEKVIVDTDFLELQVNTSCDINTLIQGAKGYVFASSSLHIYDKSSNSNFLYDTSFPYNSSNLVKSLNSIELQPENINYIIISHWHFDHCGSIELFKNATLIMSYETYRSVDYFDKAIKYSLTQTKPTESLTEILFQKMNEHRKKAELEITVNDNYKYFDNYSKVRAVANIIINNSNMYTQIIDKVNSGNAKLVKDKTKQLSPNLMLYNLNLHTDGDLVLGIKDDNSFIYCVGDILEDNSEGTFESLIQNSYISLEDSQLLTHIFSPGNKIITGHGNEFIIDKSGKMCEIKFCKQDA